MAENWHDYAQFTEISWNYITNSSGALREAKRLERLGFWARECGAGKIVDGRP
jgi:hypothetical protein